LGILNKRTIVWSIGTKQVKTYVPRCNQKLLLKTIQSSQWVRWVVVLGKLKGNWYIVSSTHLFLASKNVIKDICENINVIHLLCIKHNPLPSNCLLIPWDHLKIIRYYNYLCNQKRRWVRISSKGGLQKSQQYIPFWPTNGDSKGITYFPLHRGIALSFGSQLVQYFQMWSWRWVGMNCTHGSPVKCHPLLQGRYNHCYCNREITIVVGKYMFFWLNITCLFMIFHR